MSTGNVIKCTCCGDDVEEEKSYVDLDMESPVCPECKVNLRYAQATLCGPREQPGPWVDHFPDPK